MKLKRGVMKAADLTDLVFVNTPAIRLQDLAGRVTMVHFWDYACVNCLRTLSYLKVWYGRYADKGLSLVGIHAPEFDFGSDIVNVRRAIEELGVQFPVAMDNSFSTWQAYSNRFWPATYLIDRDGFLSDYHFGEGGYEETEVAIQALLREANPRLLLPRTIEPLRPEDSGQFAAPPVSPEVYFGYRRGRIGNDEGFSPGGTQRYDRALPTVRDVFYLEGEFASHPDCVAHVGTEPGRCQVSCEAADTFIVAAPAVDGQAGWLEIRQDGLPLDESSAGEAVVLGPQGARVRVDAPRLYAVVRNPDCGRHVIELSTSSPGLRLYCLSFVGSAS